VDLTIVRLPWFPITLTRLITSITEEFDLFLKGWATKAEKFKDQPRFISTQPHKGIG
jgi:hypothetical protein